MTEKSILEQALLQVNTLEEAVKQNAKGILSSVMKQELNELLKESEEEEEEVAAEEEAMNPEEEESKDMSEQPASDEEEEDDAEEADDEEMPSINDEPSKDVDDESPAMDDMPSMDEPADDDMLDMTGASDEEVLKVFKAMSDEDGIVVKKDGNNIELKDEDDEYIIKLDESEEEEEGEVSEEEEIEIPEDWNEEESMEEVAEEEEASEETVYEIELDDEDMEDSEKESEMAEEDAMEVEATEAARTKWNKHGDKGGSDRAGLKSKKVFAAGAINEEVENLKKQNSEYKKALVLFKEKLNEVAVFNANLAYATRLFTEHSTTKQEKLNILKRFDSISTINESKNLYNSIKAELETKKPVTESVVEKIATTPSSSSSQEMLAESKAYENPQFRRMKDLMSKLK
jgi:hypothetical protein